MQASQESSNVTSPLAAHVKECSFKVVLRINALCLVFSDDLSPASNSGVIVAESDCSGVREPLQEKVASDSILVFPFLLRLLFISGGVVWVGCKRARLGAIKMAPSPRSLHCFLKAHLEDGPVGTVGLKTRDVGR